MSQPCSLSELNEVLVPFTARRITSSLIWCAEDVRNPETLQNACSYIIDPGSSASAKTFHAERYGGSGIQRNGGGARCGFCSAAIFFAPKRDKFCTARRCQKDRFCTVQK